MANKVLKNVDGTKEYEYWKNDSGHALVNGNVVVVDTANVEEVVVVNTANHTRVKGVVIHPIADGDYGWIQVNGIHDKVKLTNVGGGNITAGQAVGTCTTTGYAGKGTGLGIYIGSSTISSVTTGAVDLNPMMSVAWAATAACTIANLTATTIHDATSLTGAGNFLIDVTGNLALSADTSLSAESLAMELSANDITLTVGDEYAVNVGDNAVFTIADDLTLTTTDGALNIDAGGAGGALKLSADVSMSAGSPAIELSANDITFTATDEYRVNCGDNIWLDAADDVSISGDTVGISGTTNITLSGVDIFLKTGDDLSGYAVDDLDLKCEGSASLTSSGEIRIDSATNLVLSADVSLSAQSPAMELSANDITLTVGDEYRVNCGDNIWLDAADDVSISGDTVGISGTTNITLSGVDIFLKAGDDLSGYAVDDMDFKSEGSASVTSSGEIRIDAATNLVLSADVSMSAESPAIELSAGVCTITAAGTANIVSPRVINTVTDIEIAAASDISGHAVADIILQGEANIYAISSGDITISGDNVNVSAVTAVTISAGDIFLKAADDLSGYAIDDMDFLAEGSASITTSGEIRLDTTDNLVLSADTSLSAGSPAIELSAGAITMTTPNAYINGPLRLGTTYVTGANAKVTWDVDGSNASCVVVSGKTGECLLSGDSATLADGQLLFMHCLSGSQTWGLHPANDGLAATSAVVVAGSGATFIASGNIWRPVSHLL